MKDYYNILGVSREVSEAELKKVYHKLALKYHPDRNPDDPTAEKKFKEIAEAYSVLGDIKKRAQYDNGGFSNSFSDPFGDGFDPFGIHKGRVPIDLMDFFQGMGFGQHAQAGDAQAAQQQRAPAGEQIETAITLTLEDALEGCKYKVNVSRRMRCGVCKGTGVKNEPDAYENCKKCFGHGQIHGRQGPFRISRTCFACAGQGKIIKKPCDECSGHKLKDRQEQIEINIPAGIAAGHVIRIRDKGHESEDENSQPGDLYVHIHMQPHNIFTRQGEDLYMEQKIPFTLAVLGGKFSLPILSRVVETKEIELSAGMLDGREIQFPCLGLPAVGASVSHRGKQVVKFVIDIPRKQDLTDEQIILLNQLHGGLL